MQPDADTCPVAPLWIEPEPSLRETPIAGDVPNSTPVFVAVMEAHLMNGPTRWPD